jgi:hypothetical protein
VLASALTGYSAGGAFTCVVHEQDEDGTAAAIDRSLDEAFGATTLTRTGVRQDAFVPVAAGADGRRRGWAVAQYLVAHAGPLKIRAVAFDGRTWRVGRDSEKGWTPSRASAEKVSVTLG